MNRVPHRARLDTFVALLGSGLHAVGVELDPDFLSHSGDYDHSVEDAAATAALLFHSHESLVHLIWLVTWLVVVLEVPVCEHLLGVVVHRD